MVLNIVLLIVGIALLIKGADLFVNGSSKIAKALKIPSIIIGLTLVSIGTSLPEASVSINASISNLNEMSVSNAVGSNIVNTLVILGVSSIFIPLTIDKDMKKYDIPIMIGIYLVLILFGFIITPYKLNLIESLTLLAILVSYIMFLIFRTKKNNKEIKETETKEVVNKWYVIKGVVFSILGAAMIILGGDFVVDSASNIAIRLGMSEVLVGLTIVAVGTSLPELVTSVVASIKKENDIALGNVIGSNIFNIVFILGSSSTISSLTVSPAMLFDIVVMLMSGVAILIISCFSKKIERWQGLLLLAAYVSYLTYIIIRN